MNFQSILVNFFTEDLKMSNGISLLLMEISTLATLLCASTLAYLAIKIIYSIYVNKIINNKNKSLSDAILKNKFINSILKILPGSIVYIFSGIFTVDNISWTIQMSQLIESLSLLYILVFLMKSIFISLELIKEWFQKREHAQYSLIKSFMQVLKIIIIFIAIIIAISIIMNRSPLILLTGLGALSAVLLLVFKDSLIGLVANIQVSAYDTVRIGDWVTIPSHGADGTIMDININIVTIQNFDKTVISVPTGALITNSVTNWRGMFESGGRRIKRSIKIDINTIKFCNEELLAKLEKVDYLGDFIRENKSPITNATLFRRYITQYLTHSPKIHNEGFLMLVRHLESTELGLPIEIYAFTTDTSWANYEPIQADIFDHLFAIIGAFEMRVFQLNACRQKN